MEKHRSDKFEEKPNMVTGLDMEAGEKLPAIEVKNEVVWVNNDVEMPFKFEEDKPSKIGVFLTPKPKRGESVFNVSVMDNHFRSAILGKVVFRDKEGNLYRDVDIKGMGGLGLNITVEPIKVGSARKLEKGVTSWGIMDWGFAETDRNMSEFFIKQGLRTHRALAIIRLDEIIVENGEKISIPKARKLGYIKHTTEPVIEVRAFGTKARVADANNQILSKDAKHMVAQELGENPNDFSDEDYIKWFAKTLGKQVAIIHNSGFTHGYLTEHNITLDCRVVDLDSVDEIKDKKWIDDAKINNDLVLAMATLKKFCRSQRNAYCEDTSQEFFNSYASSILSANKDATEDMNRLKRALYYEIYR